MQGKISSQEFTWRPVGFKEVWALLDLDRYDEVLLEDMHRTNERVRVGLVELFQLDRPENTKPLPKDTVDENGVHHPQPVSDKTNTGKSLGVMGVDEVKAKFM